MTQFSVVSTCALDASIAAEELTGEVEAQLLQGESVAGGLILATAAGGEEARLVSHFLAERWPQAVFVGTSFEGILASGRIFRDQPALALLVWPAGPMEPIPLAFPREDFEAAASATEMAAEILEGVFHASGRRELSAGDLVLLFPDAVETPNLEALLCELGAGIGQASLAGAGATGVGGYPARAFSEGISLPGGLVGLFVPGFDAEKEPQGDEGPRLVRCATASRSASPWLGITACRSRWIDGLDGEPPLDWVRRQLGLDPADPIESHLDRLLIRVRRPAAKDEPTQESDLEYDERYVIGVDGNRGSLSIPGNFALGDQLAFALPDAGRAREGLRRAVEDLAAARILLQFACRARDERLYGDPDLESAWAAHYAADRSIVGTVAPFQFAKGCGRGGKHGVGGAGRLLVHSTVVAGLGRR